MPDTARTLSALQTLLADNGIGAISPQDLRDMLVSAMGGYGCLYVSGGSTAQTGIGGTPVSVTGFTNISGASSQCTPAHATDDITIDVGGTWLAVWTASFSGSNNATFLGQIACTGTGTVYGGSWERKLGAGGDVGCAATVGIITGAVSTDVVDCLISSDGTSDSITPSEMTLAIVRIN